MLSARPSVKLVTRLLVGTWLWVSAMSARADWPVFEFEDPVPALPKSGSVWPLPTPPVDEQRERLNEPPPLLPPSVLTDRFGVSLGVFPALLGSNGRVDSSTFLTGRGTPFTGEGDLALRDRKVMFPDASLMLRLGSRERVDFSVLQFDRVGALTLAQPISYLNATYNPGDRLQSEFDWRVMKGAVLIDVLHGDRYAVSLLAGIQVEQIFSALQVDVRSIRNSVSATGVLPVVGLEATWLFGPNSRWSLVGRGEYFNTERLYFVYRAQQFGATRDLRANLQYRWYPNVSLGLGYTNFRASAEVQTATPLFLSTGVFGFAASGPEVFFRVSF
jgi:hypothetical protein